jgi:hypothetical protein
VPDKVATLDPVVSEPAKAVAATTWVPVASVAVGKPATWVPVVSETEGPTTTLVPVVSETADKTATSAPVVSETVDKTTTLAPVVSETVGKTTILALVVSETTTLVLEGLETVGEVDSGREGLETVSMARTMDPAGSETTDR